MTKAATLAVVAFSLTACGGREVSGPVASKYTEKDCKSLSMAPVVHEAAGRVGGSGGGPRSSSGGSGGGGSSLRKGGGKVGKGGPRKDGDGGPGIDIPDAPDAPDARSAGPCGTSYYLVIKERKRLVPQKVDSVRYSRCSKGEEFPRCAK